MHTRTHTHAHAHTRTHTHTHAHTHVHTHMHMYTRTRTHTHTHTHTDTCGIDFYHHCCHPLGQSQDFLHHRTVIPALSSEQLHPLCTGTRRDGQWKDVPQATSPPGSSGRLQLTQWLVSNCLSYLLVR